MFRLETKNHPRGKAIRAGDNDAAYCVRIYKNSPEDLILQMWSGKRYMLVALLPHEACMIADQLIAVADMIKEDKVA